MLARFAAIVALQAALAVGVAIWLACLADWFLN